MMSQNKVMALDRSNMDFSNMYMLEAVSYTHLTLPTICSV